MIARTILVTASTCLMLAAHHAIQAQDFKTLLKAKMAKSSALNYASKEIPYPHLVTTEEVVQEDGDIMKFRGNYKVDPFANAGRRVTLSGPNSTFSQDTLNEIKMLNETYTQSEISEGFWCPSDNDEDFRDILTAHDTQILEETEDYVVLLVGAKTMLKTIFSEEEDDLPRKLRKRMRAKLTLSKPDLIIRNIHLELTRPTKIKIVAKILEFKINMNCQIAPNGTPYISETKTSIRGKALGSAFSSKAKISVSQLEQSF